MVAGLVGAAIALLVLAVAAYFFYSERLERLTFQTQNEKSVFEEIKQDTWSSRGSDSTVEALNSYVAELTRQIEDPELSRTSRKLLMIRKSLSLGAVRMDGIPNDDINEAASILRSVYASEPQNDLEVLYKNATIPAFMNLLITSCYLPSLGGGLPSGFDTEYDQLRDRGFHEKAAVILAFHNFAHDALDEVYGNDISTIASRAYLGALYLYTFGEDAAEESENILRMLQIDIDQYDLSEPRTLTGLIKGEVEPTLYYAFAYDIANTHDTETVSDETNRAIDQNYKNVYLATGKIAGDDTSRAVIDVLNTVAYLESLHRRYTPEELDVAEVDRLIDIFIESLSHNKETKGLFTGYLVEGKTEIGEWMLQRANFYDVASKYPKLKQFIEEVSGIEV